MRLDQWLVDNAFARDLRHAAGLILSGDVLVNDKPVTSAGFNVKNTDAVRIRNQRKWVSRSAEKLDYALKKFRYDVRGKVVLDAGSSTGGFTQVLLLEGARLVIAVDVAYGFLHPTLRVDPRVKVMERTHICDLTEESLQPRPDCFVADLSFISLKKVLPCLKKIYESWEGIVLFKPQFEVAPEDLVQGIVKNSDIVLDSIEDFKRFLMESNIRALDQAESPILGRKGNQEYLFLIQW